MHEQQVSQMIRDQQQALAKASVTRQYARQGQIWKPYGDIGHQKSVRDAGYHLMYLAEAVSVADKTLFVDYVGWVKVLFAGLRFSDDVLPETLTCIRESLAERLPAEAAHVATAYIDASLHYLQHAPTTIPTFIDPAAPLGNLAREYLDLLLQGARHEASRLILDTVERGVAIEDIYLEVFQRVQHVIGRLWQTNQISVAQEHYCTAATQFTMSQLYPYIFAHEKSGRQLVATCVGGELHEIGVRMVADFFEMAGWDTYYLGANTPASSIVQTLEEREAHVLAISATLTTHISKVAALIEQIHAAAMAQQPRILVGGYPFNVSPDLWRAVGADGYATNAQQAIAAAEQLLVE